MTAGVLSPAQNASKSAVSATPQNFLPLRGLRMMAPPGAGVLIEGRARGKRLRYDLKLLFAGLRVGHAEDLRRRARSGALQAS